MCQCFSWKKKLDKINYSKNNLKGILAIKKINIVGYALIYQEIFWSIILELSFLCVCVYIYWHCVCFFLYVNPCVLCVCHHQCSYFNCVFSFVAVDFISSIFGGLGPLPLLILNWMNLYQLILVGLCLLAIYVEINWNITKIILNKPLLKFHQNYSIWDCFY